jgi:NADPH:quinone reductase-like Zn-dependent oxidoreductase
MKAVICSAYGPPEVLKIGEIDKPSPKANEILIKIETTSVSVGDIRIRGFKVPIGFWLPARLSLGFFRPRHAVLGSVLAGKIEDVGGNVKQFRKDDDVVALTGHSFGAYAEYICMKESEAIAKRPANLSFTEIVAIPWGGYTSMYFLDQAGIKPGQKVMVYGASGSLGTAAIQLAKHYGAEVTAVCSTANFELVKSLGADHVIDYTREEVFKRGDKYDVIYETVGKTSVLKAMGALKKNGILLHAVLIPTSALYLKPIFALNNRKIIGGTFVPDANGLNRITEFVGKGILKPVIDRIYKLEEIVEAHRYVELGHKKGSVVITIKNK